MGRFTVTKGGMAVGATIALVGGVFGAAMAGPSSSEFDELRAAIGDPVTVTTEAPAAPGETVTITETVAETQTETETVTVEETITMPVTVTETVVKEAPKPKPSATFAGDGTYLVGEDIKPGTYRSRPADPEFSCFWSRLSGLSGEFDDVIANDLSDGPFVVEISASDVAFTATRCADFERIK